MSFELTAKTLLFLYDEDGYFTATSLPQPNPRRPGSFFTKSNSTTIDPQIKDGFWSKWDGEKWSYEKKPTTPEELAGMKISHTSFTNRAIELRKIKDDLITPESGYKAELVDNRWIVSKIPEPTEKEKKEKLAQEIRAKRDALLQETDFIFLSDNPKGLTDEQKEEVTVYRNALRELPEQSGFPEQVTWPKPPECIVKDVEKITPSGEDEA